MKLTKDERKQVDTLFTDKRRPGMILWMEPRDGDTYAKGFCQCDPFDAMAMAAFAVEMFAACYGLEPKVAAQGLVKFFEGGDHKPSDINGEIRLL